MLCACFQPSNSAITDVLLPGNLKADSVATLFSTGTLVVATWFIDKWCSDSRDSCAVSRLVWE